MPREGLQTKEKLIRAGEHLFARAGVDGALTRDIVARAGQANDSAIHYHFGSRRGLLSAILDKHVQQMEAERRATLGRLGDRARLNTVVNAVVAPVAGKLRSEEGRDFLRIIAQLADRAPRGGDHGWPLAGTALAEQLDLLHEACRSRLNRDIADERVAMMITTLTAALAERARHLEGGRPLALTHDQYVANLVDVLTAIMRAPSSAEPDPSRR